MKKKKLLELIQKPLRFHHQDIHEELDEIKKQLAFQNECLKGLSQALSLNAQFLHEVLERNLVQQVNADSERRDSTDTDP